MDSLDSRILETALRWLPYGGPPTEEILVDFGMTELRFDQHVARILHSDSASHLAPGDRATLFNQLQNRDERRRPSIPARFSSLSLDRTTGTAG
ncbi:hypothetical protein [Nocardia sp. NPDC004860]|uniref:hypothetical protein n=1 Tax=Nocardia sp. NPDC004860 TaxID=3154557 RepID=UPI0033A6194D